MAYYWFDTHYCERTIITLAQLQVRLLKQTVLEILNPVGNQLIVLI